MRLGKNEKKILLAILNLLSNIMELTMFSFGKKNSQERVILANKMWGNWLVKNEKGKYVWDNTKAVKLTSSLKSLREKDLITDRVHPRLTDLGIKIAQSIQAEIESYIEEWLPFTSEEFRNNIL